MKCPICGSKGLKTTNSRPTLSGTQTWRRKSCQKCQSSITTYEKPDMGWLSVKCAKDNKSTPYKRFILAKSISEAFDGNNEHIMADIDSLVDTVEIKIIQSKLTIIDNKELIKIVLNTIKPISLRAYMQYLASHSNPHSQRELNSLLSKL